MNPILKKLTDWGCDVKSGMSLAMGNEALYIECLGDVTESESYTELTEALNNKDIKAAFNASHDLKGMYANMGLTPMYEKSVEIVDPLRAGNCPDELQTRTDELMELNQHLKDMLKD